MVRELPVTRLGRIQPSRMATVSVGCVIAHQLPSSASDLMGLVILLKVDVRLVSFSLSGVRNDLASNQDPPRPVPACIHRNCGEVIPSWLRQVPQHFIQFGQPVDFRYGTLQRLHRGSDVLEEMFVTLDQTKKSVST